ncbi:hypothetical protein PORCRE_517 [Porphyromonas crevioricanis JCM 15906]|uniref:Uncharacterized protein n=1 Tax=Porphyromonas crevioricanis JCM 15906 TaxID=1305617 RepID=T1CGK3_9PORP|nr:hypothetical protein PORCRE_517 [Porphyromonas crevioricanis JCM 15906]GAD07355.1 hypothetical protein PORCAN_975 [Porphyromonas crevioricanis JCM 13913]
MEAQEGETGREALGRWCSASLFLRENDNPYLHIQIQQR